MNLREWALPVYTILIQLVTGMLFVLWAIRTFAHTKENEEYLDELAKIPILIVAFTIVVAIVGSHAHLSHPFKSFLAVSNFATSWLSREIVFTLVMFIFTAALLSRLWLNQGDFRTKTLLGWGAIVSGACTLWCMAHIYLLPTQLAWNTSATIFSTYGTAMLLGVFSLVVIFLMDIRFTQTVNMALARQKSKIVHRSIRGLIWFSVAAATWVVVADLLQIYLMYDLDLRSVQTSLELILDLYQPLLILRFSMLGVGLVCFVICSARTLVKKLDLNEMIGPVYLACLAVLVGEILERFLFYATHVRIGI